MLLTTFLAVVFCAAMALMLLSAVAFIQDNKFFSSAPEAVREVIVQRDQELFYGARRIGWTLMIISILMVLGAGVIAIWDGFRSEFTFWQFFLRFALIFTIYKICDMVLIDYFLLLKFRFFQYYYPEGERVMEGRKYGFNIKSQLLKIFVIPKGQKLCPAKLLGHPWHMPPAEHSLWQIILPASIYSRLRPRWQPGYAHYFKF